MMCFVPLRLIQDNLMTALPALGALRAWGRVGRVS